MKIGDLNNVKYTEMYETIEKLSPFKEVKHCINNLISENCKAYTNSISHYIEEKSGEDIRLYTEVYKVIQKCEPVNVYENMIREIDMAMKKYQIENIDDDEFSLFSYNKSSMFRFYNCIKNLNKHLLFRHGNDEIFLTYELSNDIVSSIKVERKEYIFKIDYENPSYSLHYYYNDTEKIVIKTIQSSQFSIKMKDCEYVLYTPSKKA